LVFVTPAKCDRVHRQFCLCQSDVDSTFLLLTELLLLTQSDFVVMTIKQVEPNTESSHRTLKYESESRLKLNNRRNDILAHTETPVRDKHEHKA